MSNRKNPAVKRILADVRELQTHPSSRYFAAPLEDNMFEWHFTIRGPADSAFADGVYHGRILLPTDYPFKPPNIVFLTKNGRFEVGTKICLSISAYHEESWQPAWGVRTMLEAIISFMPSEGMGAIGALDWTVEERKKLATESKSFCCSVCGKVADLLSDPALDAPSSESEKEKQALADQIAQMSMKVAPAPSSPHVGQHHSLSGDIPGAGMALRASNFAGGATDMEIGPFSVQEGTSSVDMITTTVTAPPLEDSDGVADFLPDLTDRMSEFDNNNIDAEDNFDALGMMETLPAAAKAGRKGVMAVGGGKIVQDEETAHEEDASSLGSESKASCVESNANANFNNDSSSAAEKLGKDYSKRESNTTELTSAVETDSMLSPQSVLRNRKTHKEGSKSGSSCYDASASNDHLHEEGYDSSNAHSEHSPAGCCSGHRGHSATRSAGAESTSSSTSFSIGTTCTDSDSPVAKEGGDEALHDTTELNENRINLAQQRLAQNLQQVPVPNGNVQFGGVRAVRAELLVDNGNNAAENRDVVDEWLSVVLIALGTTIALMGWRIVLRYYSLFLL
eukprot:gene9213-10868_t